MGKSPTLKVSEQLVGRFFNAFGDTIDGGPDIEGDVYKRQVKLTGIDGGPHKRRNMWFNSMIREEPYPGLNCTRDVYKRQAV